MSVDENKTLVRRYFEDFANNGNLAVASQIVVPQHREDVQQLITRESRYYWSFLRGKNATGELSVQRRTCL